MKIKTVLFSLLVVLFLFSCSTDFLIGPKNLKNGVFNYIVGGNGLDYVKISFDSTGENGVYEKGSYTFDFATADAEASGKYTDKTWFMYSGERGDFTYNAGTYHLDISLTHQYTRKENATTYYTADYEWRTILNAYKDSNPAATEYFINMERYFVINQDSPLIQTFFIKNGDAWTNEVIQTVRSTEGGITSINSEKRSISMTISGTSITQAYKVEVSEKVGNAATEYETQVQNRTFKVNNFFISGEETTSKMTFDKVWKEGNNITFLIELTRSETIEYIGTAAPTTPPTVDPVTGLGNSGSPGEWSWEIDQTGGSADKLALSHFGEVIISTEELSNSYRGF